MGVSKQAAHQRFPTPQTAGRDLHPPTPPNSPPPELQHLTPREPVVLALVARGLSNAEIATEFVLSEATVKTHVKHVLANVDARDFAFKPSSCFRGETHRTTR